MKFYLLALTAICMLQVSCKKSDQITPLTTNAWRIDKVTYNATDITSAHGLTTRWLRATDGTHAVVFYFAAASRLNDGRYKVVDAYKGTPEKLDEVSITTMIKGANGLVSTGWGDVYATISHLNGDKLSIQVEGAPLIDLTTGFSINLSADLTEH